MKIGKNSAGPTKLEPRPDEQVSLSGPLQRRALDSPHASSPHANHAPRCLNPSQILLCNLKMLGMERVATDRLKCSESHMQRHVRDVGPCRPAALQNLGREVQPRRRRRNRSRLAGKNRLVPAAVLGTVRTLDIGRQRYVADALENVENEFVRAKSQRAFAELAAP